MNFFKLSGQVPGAAAGTGQMSGWRRWCSVLLGWSLLLVASLGGCGGGVEGQGTGSFSYVQGAISGFGSIIVNGVEFFDDSASVTDEDGQALSSSDLKLGMTVAVQGGQIDSSTSSAQASRISISSALVGPVASRNLSAGTLTILGQTVRIGSATVFDESLSSGLASVSVGNVLKVHAYFDESESLFVARRVALSSASAGLYCISGPVSSLDIAARTFRIGPATYIDKVGGLLSSLTAGQTARIKLSGEQDSAGRWIVSAAAAALREAPNGAGAQVEGLIGPDLAGKQFVLDGVSVNASSAAVLPAGTTLATGQRVKVEGKISSGTLVATLVKVEVRDDKGEVDSGGGAFEIKGLIESVDATKSLLRVRGVPVVWSSSTVFKDGSANDLRTGVKVEIKGRLGAAGTGVQATEIQIDK